MPNHTLTKVRAKLLAALEATNDVEELDKLTARLLEIDSRLKRKRPVSGQVKPPASDAGGLLD